MKTMTLCNSTRSAFNKQLFRNRGAVAWLLAIAIFLSACSQITVQQTARKEFDQGRVEESLAQLQDAISKDPQDAQLQVAYYGLRERAINLWLRQQALLTSSSERTQLLRRVLAIDPDNKRAKAELEKMDQDSKLAKLILDAQFGIDIQDYKGANRLLRSVLADDPYNKIAQQLMKTVTDKTTKPAVDASLEQALNVKLSIEFKEAMLKQIFEVLSRTSNINFVLDKDIKSDLRTSVFLKDVTVKEAMDVVLLSNQLEKRIVGNNSIMIYPNLPAKLKDYQSLNVHTFYIANADVEQLSNTLKTILKTKDLVVDKSQNIIMMRDTPDAIEMAEKIVALEDMPTPELMLEVEILEINHNLLQDIGVTYPPKLALTPLSKTSGTTVTLADIINLRSSSVGATFDPLTINLTGTDSDVKTLANPRIRVKNREAAKVLIGDRVPNITSTATATGFISQNVQYLDVGLKLEVTPVITIDNEVSMKILLEVSNIASQITTSSGTVAYQIGNRSASTVLRLKDGENQILAGLINDQQSGTVNKIPGLGDIPLLGRLFSDHNDTHNNTEIVLSITPHVIRNSPLPASNLVDFQSGTESNLHGGSQSGGYSAPAISTTTNSPTPQTGVTTQQPQATNSNGIGSTGNGTAGFGAPGNNAFSGSPNTLNSTNGQINSSGGAIPINATVGVNGNQSEGVVGTGAVAGGAINSNSLTWVGATQATVGTSIQQQLTLSSSQGINGVNLVIGYDPTILTVGQVTEGTFMNADGTTTTFSQRVDPSTGQIYISDIRSSSTTVGASGQAVLFTLNATATKASELTQLKVLSVTPTVVGGAGLSLPTPTQSIIVQSTQ
ncbi:general secretion pathway protein D [Oxalobacteraceae bacterium GrIS 1.18]